MIFVERNSGPRYKLHMKVVDRGTDCVSSYSSLFI